jgi:hypothetical protein
MPLSVLETRVNLYEGLKKNNVLLVDTQKYLPVAIDGVYIEKVYNKKKLIHFNQ